MGKSLTIKGADFSANAIDDITRYGIVYSLTNIDTANSTLPTSIKQGGTATIKFVKPIGYSYPLSVTVTGATPEYNATTGVLKLTAATGVVTIIAAGIADNTPTIISSEQSLSFNGIYGESAELSLVVSGLNLTDPISVAVGGTDAADFTPSVNSVSATDAAQGKTVKITYVPSSVGSHVASLTLSSTGADSVTIPLVGIAAQKVDVTADFDSWQSGSSWYREAANGTIIRDTSGVFDTSTYQVPAAYIGKKIHFTFFKYESSGGTRPNFVNAFFDSNDGPLTYLQCEDSGTPSTAIAVDAEMVIPAGASYFGVMYPNATKQSQFDMPAFSAYVIV